MTDRPRLPFITALAAALIASTALLLFVGRAIAQEPIKIGFHGALTGPAAADGRSSEAAIRMVIEETNAAGGVNGRRIELITYDDQLKADEAVPIANKLVGENVAAVISAGYSLPTKVAAPIYQGAGVPYLVVFAQQSDLTKTGDYIFRMGFLGNVEARAAAKYIGEVLGKKRVAVVTVKADFGRANVQGFKGVAKKFGIDIVGEFEYSPGDRQFGPMVAAIRAVNPDLVYVSGFYFTGAPFLRQLRAGGVTVPFVGTGSFSSSKFLEIAGDAAEGAMITDIIDWRSSDPVDAKFRAEFEKRLGVTVDDPAALGYATAQVLIAALKDAGTDRGKLRDRLARTDMKTVAGQIKLSAGREVIRSFLINTAQKGRWNTSDQVDDAALLSPDLE